MTEPNQECSRAREAVTAIAEIVRTAGETIPLQTPAPRLIADKPECARAVDVVSAVGEILRAGQSEAPPKEAPPKEAPTKTPEQPSQADRRVRGL